MSFAASASVRAPRRRRPVDARAAGSPGGPAGDDAGTGRGRTHDHLAGAMMAACFVMDGAAILQRNLDHGLLGFFGRLADGFRHFARLAMAEADAAIAVANHHQSGEAETAATLHDLGDTVDVHQLVDQVAVFFFAVTTAAAVTAPAILVVPLLSFARHIANP